ncbi:hypothetical protein SH449x_003643 [Pirellulaceae bacterium SH449]
MRFDLFEAMSIDEATNVLDEFLHRGAEILKAEQIEYNTVSLSELPDKLLEIGLRLTTIPVAADPSVPEFIRNTDDYKEGLFEFTEDSKRLIIGAAYMLGNCFVREFTKLAWCTGNPEYATGRMPVITGFASGEELTPLLVANNLFRRLVKNRSLTKIFETFVERWSASV